MLKLPSTGYALKHSDGRVSLRSFSAHEAEAWDHIALGEKITSPEKNRHLDAGVTVVRVEAREIKRKGSTRA